MSKVDIAIAKVDITTSHDIATSIFDRHMTLRMTFFSQISTKCKNSLENKQIYVSKHFKIRAVYGTWEQVRTVQAQQTSEVYTVVRTMVRSTTVRIATNHNMLRTQTVAVFIFQAFDGGITHDSTISIFGVKFLFPVHFRSKSEPFPTHCWVDGPNMDWVKVQGQSLVLGLDSTQYNHDFRCNFQVHFHAFL